MNSKEYWNNKNGVIKCIKLQVNRKISIISCSLFSWKTEKKKEIGVLTYQQMIVSYKCHKEEGQYTSGMLEAKYTQENTSGVAQQHQQDLMWKAVYTCDYCNQKR